MKPLLKYSTIVLLTAVAISCSVRIIAPYDEITDKKVSDLNERVMIKFKEWERKIPVFINDSSFYDQSEAVLEILIARNESIKKSERIVTMLKRLRDNINIIKDRHRAGTLSSAFITEVKPDLSAQFNTIQQVQMALKSSAGD
jgi:hypothetical protein